MSDTETSDMRLLTASITFLIGICLAAPAQGQDYPFFVQPMTVRDVRNLADELELSREQSVALLGQYEAYNIAFEELQERDVKDFLDRGMDMAMQMRPWGGELSIPSREEISDLVGDGLRTLRGFGRIDRDFFDAIAPLLGDSQLARLELERDRRALSRMDMLHRNMVGEINNGAQGDLFGILRRVTIQPDLQLLVDEELARHARNILAALRQFEKSLLEAIEKVLDEIDRLGLRGMEMMEMMQIFAEEERINELKALFNDLSRPLQEASSSAASENLRAYRSLIGILPDDAVLDLRNRYIKGGFRELNRVLDRRRKLVRLLEMYEGSSEEIEIQDAIDALDAAYGTVEIPYMKAKNATRVYRTFGQLEGDEPLESLDQLTAIEDRTMAIHDRSNALVERLGDSLKESTEEKSASGGGKSDGATAKASKAIKGSNALEPISAESVQHYAQWIGLDEQVMATLELLHQDYEDRVSQIVEGTVDRMADQMSETEGWREYTALRRRLTRESVAEIAQQDARFFDDLALVMTDDKAAQTVASIRQAAVRSRNLSQFMQDDWQLEGRSEGGIEVGTLVYGIEIEGVPQEVRESMEEMLRGYGATMEPMLEELVERSKSVRELESRLWNDEADYSREVRMAMRRTWQERREKVGEAAGELAAHNRDTVDALTSAMPDEFKWRLRDAYERRAYPAAFEGEEALEDLIGQIRELELTPEQRTGVESSIDAFRMSRRDLTRDMIELSRSGDTETSFPPTRESMESSIAQAQLEYKQSQLAERTKVQLELLLEPTQVASVPAFAQVRKSEK